MVGTLTLHLKLERRCDVDDSPRPRGIVAEPDANWWFGVEGGREQ